MPVINAASSRESDGADRRRWLPGSFRVFGRYALVALLAGPALYAQDASFVEARLRALEQRVDSLAAENADLKRQLGHDKPVAPVVVQPAGKVTRLAIGGFLHGQAEFGDAADSRWTGVNDRFFFRRARIHVAGSFAEDFDFKAEVDLQGNTLGAGAGQLARANEIFINWHKYPQANLRFGQLKPAFGAEALLSDTKMLTIERSLSSDRLADGRNLALAAAGELVPNKLSYYAMVANGNGANVSGNDNNAFQRSARVVFTPLAARGHTLQLGVDGLWSTDAGIGKSDLGLPGNLFRGSREMAGVDARWVVGRFELEGEWLRGKFRPDNAANFEAEGWHATVGYFLLPEKLQVVFRQEEFDPNDAVGGDGYRTRLVGLNYRLKGDDLKFMINYLDGAAHGTFEGGSRLLLRTQLVY